MNENIIEIKNLSFGYEKNPILSDFSLSIQEGSFWAILGPNGSGKTTLINLIANLLKPATGEIFIDNIEIKNYSTKKLAQKIAVVPQHQELIYDITVFDLIMMGRNPHQNRWETGNANDLKIVNEVLVKCDLTHLKHRMTKQLSGGEFQRTIIARAMAQQSKIILLDEPLSNLDIAHKFETMELITRLNKEEKCTIIIILHDLNFVENYIPNTILLKDGNIFAQGKTAQILNESNLKAVFNLNNRFIEMMKSGH